MSALPMVVRHVRFGAPLGSSHKMENYIQKEFHDSYVGLSSQAMAEGLARRCNVTREDADEYALQSHMRWKAGQKLHQQQSIGERFNTMSETNFVFMQAACISRKEDGTWDLMPPERVVKLKLPEHLEAYTQQKSVRKVGSISCDNDLVQQVMCNYLIAEKILSYLSWQDHLACEALSETWRLAVKNLRRNTRGSNVLVVDQCHWQVKAKSTNRFFNEPMAVLTFCDQKKFARYVHYSTAACKNIVPSPCQPPCKERHLLMDYLQYQLCGPKSCMLTVFADTSSPHFLNGVYIPSIPDVEFRVMKMNSTMSSQKDIKSKIQQLAQTHNFLGALVYHTHSNDIIEYLKNVQPKIPFAIGGCYVRYTRCEQSDIDEMINLHGTNLEQTWSKFRVSVGLFCVRRNASDTDESTEKRNFDMFSLVIKKNDDKEQAVNEFANKIPHFEHSVGIKLSDDESRDEINEERYFQAAFPNTPIVGCRSCYVVGLNHPAPPGAASSIRWTSFNFESKVFQPSIYCTAFVYIGWGKIVKPAAQPS